MANLKDAMKASKATGKRQKVTEPTASSVKVNTSVSLDVEVLHWLKQEGDKLGLGYSTYLNSFVKSRMNLETLEERVARLEAEIKKIKAG